MESPKNFVLLEETEVESEVANSGSTKGKHRENFYTLSKRILDDNEKVYLAQVAWKGKGLFRLAKADEINLTMKNEILLNSESSFKNVRTFHRVTRSAKGSLKKLNRFSRFSKSSIPSDSDTGSSKAGSTNSKACDTHSLSEINKSEFSEDRRCFKNLIKHELAKNEQLEEPINLSNIEANHKTKTSFSKFTRLSLKKFKVWKN